MVCAFYIKLHFFKIGLTQRECSPSVFHIYIHIYTFQFIFTKTLKDFSAVRYSVLETGPVGRLA